MTERAGQFTVYSSQFTENEVSPRQESVGWLIPKEFEGIMTYNPRHDIQDFLDLANLQGKIPPEEFAQRQIQTINRTKRQLEKTLGERFRVRKSQVEYFIENGALKNPDYKEPVIQRYEKGKRFLAQNGSVETERESAEVAGMRQIEQIFSEGKVRDGNKVIIVSPRGPEGTLYNDNYFDVYEQIEGKITMTRYHSTHDYQGFLTATKTADPTFDRPSTEKVNDAYFLERPITTSLSTEQILETFALDLDTQSEEINQKIIEGCMPYINYRIRVLIERLLDFEENKKSINTIYNVADKIEKKTRITARIKIEPKAFLPFPTIGQAVDFYGRQPVRALSFGCPGGQRGFSIGQPSSLVQLGRAIGARSVVDFAPFADSQNEDTSDFPCPQCGHIITYGAGIRECPGCGLAATCG